MNERIQFCEPHTICSTGGNSPRLRGIRSQPGVENGTRVVRKARIKAKGRRRLLASQARARNRRFSFEAIINGSVLLGLGRTTLSPATQGALHGIDEQSPTDAKWDTDKRHRQQVQPGGLRGCRSSTIPTTTSATSRRAQRLQVANYLGVFVGMRRGARIQRRDSAETDPGGHVPEDVRIVQ
jgi:hypothetical protein